MEWSHSKGLLHCQTLHEEQSGSRSSKSVKQDMEEENVLQSTINGENLPIIIESDLEKWFFNSYSRGYHKYINIWEPLIYRKEKGNVYDPHTMAIIRGNDVVGHVPQSICGFF